MQPMFVYNAAICGRASKDGPDSNTIENQIERIRGFTKTKPDIRVVSVWADNGYSGVDFLRPQFNEMVGEIEAGKANCVIVKDLSWLGRNYIEVGELVERVFPCCHVRLISVNDHYDSLDTKRKHGDFVASFAPYGYKRDEADKNKLAVDEYAAGVVRDIFRMKMDGMSQQKIADRLNGIGEPSPAEHKKRDTNYRAWFQTHARASWSAVAVGRIVCNPVYIGTLAQGKQTTPSYKVKRRVGVPESEWRIVEGAHEGIVPKCDFEVVSGLPRQDTRTAPKQEMVYPLSGLIRCGDCGNSMVRTKSDSKHYYICASSRKKGKPCTSHCIQCEKLEMAVVRAAACQIALALEIEKEMEYARALPGQRQSAVKLSAQITDRGAEIQSCERYKRSLYEDYRNGIVSKEDCIGFGKDYTERIADLRQAVKTLGEEAKLLCGGGPLALDWLTHFTRHKTIPGFTRKLAVTLIEGIDVWEGKWLRVRFRYQDCLEAVAGILRDVPAETIGNAEAGKERWF